MKQFDFQPSGVTDCSVSAYLQTQIEADENGRRPAVVICPGGGYDHLSVREGEPVVKEYFAAGYQVFLMHYAVEEGARDLQPLLQLAAAVAHIRRNAEEWNVDEDKLAVCGFSAGGHLAASLGTLYDDEYFLERWKRQTGSGPDAQADIQPNAQAGIQPDAQDRIRPDAMILCYPVITADEFAHVRSLKKVSGAEPGTPEYEYFGLDRHVDEKTPPAFLWHTAQDSNVPVENSLRMAEALSAAGVSFELHVFPEGKHGMSVCTKEVGTWDPYNARWVEWSICWLNWVFGFEK